MDGADVVGEAVGLAVVGDVEGEAEGVDVVGEADGDFDGEVVGDAEGDNAVGDVDGTDMLTSTYFPPSPFQIAIAMALDGGERFSSAYAPSLFVQIKFLLWYMPGLLSSELRPFGMVCPSHPLPVNQAYTDWLATPLIWILETLPAAKLM